MHAHLKPCSASPRHKRCTQPREFEYSRVCVCMQLTMSGISTLTSGQAQWRELKVKGYNPFILAEQVLCLLHCHIQNLDKTL